MTELTKPDDSIIREQHALNLLGYGPLKENGLWDADTVNAARRFLKDQGVGFSEDIDASALDEQLDKALAARAGGPTNALPTGTLPTLNLADRANLIPANRETLSPMPMTQSGKSAASTPFYKKPVVLFGAAALAVGWYVTSRMKESGGAAVAGIKEEPKPSDEPEPARKRHKKPAVEKCGRLPTWE